jgi:glutamate racemase
LADYLKRHQEVSRRCTKNGTTHFFTTDDPAAFDRQAGLFYGQAVQSSHADL